MAQPALAILRQAITNGRRMPVLATIPESHGTFRPSHIHIEDRPSPPSILP